MSSILDIIILFIAGITIYFSVKNGFIKTVLSASAFLIAALITITLTSTVKNAYLQSPSSDKLREKVSVSLEKAIDSAGKENTGDPDSKFDAEKVIEEDGEKDEFFSVLEKFGVDRNDLKNKITEWKKDAGTDVKKMIISYITEPVTRAIVTAAVIAILFFGSLLILKIVAFVLDKVCKLPVLKTANKLLGLLLGIILAIVRVYLFCFIIKMIIPYGHTFDIGLLTALNPENTLLFKLFYNFNLFNFLLK